MARMKLVTIDQNTRSESSEGRLRSHAPQATSDLIIYEAERLRTETGVKNCQNRLDRMIEDMVNEFAAEKAKALKLEPVYKGHRGGSYSYRNSTEWDGSHECYITVYLKCVVYFNRPDKDEGAPVKRGRKTARR